MLNFDCCYCGNYSNNNTGVYSQNYQEGFRFHHQDLRYCLRSLCCCCCCCCKNYRYQRKDVGVVGDVVDVVDVVDFCCYSCCFDDIRSFDYFAAAGGGGGGGGGGEEAVYYYYSKRMTMEEE